MRKVFISYARENRPVIDQLVEQLSILGCKTWIDSSLRGGQNWWDEVLQRIADCEAFVAIISREALNSVACQREFDWAEALGKPVLPIVVEPNPPPFPRRVSERQVIDYSDPGQRDRTALMVAGSLAALAAPPLPDPLPQPPAAPLSYLTDLIDQVSQPTFLEHDRQREIIVRLEPALRSLDPEERRGGRDTLERLNTRADLFADVDRTIAQLRRIGDQPAPASAAPAEAEPGLDAAGDTALSDGQPLLSSRAGTGDQSVSGGAAFDHPAPAALVKAELPKGAYTPWIKRVGAGIIDIIPAVVGIAFAKGMQSYDLVDWAASLSTLAYVLWNYGYRQGTTGSSLGKSVLKFKLVSETTGQPIGFGPSIMRQVAHTADFATLFIGFLLPLWTAKRQTLADKIMLTVCLPT